MSLRSVELKKIPIKVLKTIFENAQKITPMWSLEHTSLNSLAATAETMLPGPILGPSRAEHFKGPDPSIPDKMVVRIVDGDYKMLFRANIDDTYTIRTKRLKLREKFVRRLTRAMYTRRASMLMDVVLPFKDKTEGVYAADDMEAICKLHYWVFPQSVPAPNMKAPEDKVYLVSVAQLVRSMKFIESYLYYMRPHDPEVRSTETGNRVSAVLVYIHCMQCKLACLFDAIDAAILRSKFNSGSSSHSVSGVYGFTRNGKGTMMSIKPSGNMVEQIRKTCPFGSDSLVESLISAFDRITYLVARWELISVEKREDVKAAMAAGMGLAWLLNGHLSYLVNMIMSVYVLWLPEHYLNSKLILAISSRVLLTQLLSTSYTSFRENAACPQMLNMQSTAEWKKQERGTEAWLNYVCARAWLRARDEGREPVNITQLNSSLADISDYVLKILDESPHATPSPPPMYTPPQWDDGAVPANLCIVNYDPGSPPLSPPPPPPAKKNTAGPVSFSRRKSSDGSNASVRPKEDRTGLVNDESAERTSTKLRGRFLSASFTRRSRKSTESSSGSAKLRGGSLRVPDSTARAQFTFEPSPSSASPSARSQWARSEDSASPSPFSSRENSPRQTPA